MARAAPTVEAKANEPNGFRRRDYALERPANAVKTARFLLPAGRCRPVYITESLDGHLSQRHNEHQIYVRVVADRWVSVSISGGIPGTDQQDPSSLTAPRTRYVEHVTWWPNLLVCAVDDAETNTSFTVEYANGAPRPAAALLSAVVACAAAVWLAA